MLEVNLVGIQLPSGDLDVVLSLLLGTLDLVPLVTGLYGSLVRFISLSLSYSLADSSLIVLRVPEIFLF